MAAWGGISDKVAPDCNQEVTTLQTRPLKTLAMVLR
jgi:hypothetical protein